jgi:hypothetical protein
MSIKPSRNNHTFLQGKFDFTVIMANGDRLIDDYDLKIIIPFNYPKEIPKVYELENKIPRDGRHHINPDDSLCLGSPFRIHIILSKNLSIVNFAENILVPYLFAISKQKKYGGPIFPDELAHGKAGILVEYQQIFKLRSKEQINYVFELLSKKRRIANKMLCPCECGLKLGSCHYHNILNQYRHVTYRSGFLEFIKDL